MLKSKYFIMVFFCYIYNVSATTYVPTEIELTVQNFIKEGFQVKVKRDVISFDDDIVDVSLSVPIEKKYMSFLQMRLYIFRSQKIVFETLLNTVVVKW